MIPVTSTLEVLVLGGSGQVAIALYNRPPPTPVLVLGSTESLAVSFDDTIEVPVLVLGNPESLVVSMLFIPEVVTGDVEGTAAATVQLSPVSQAFGATGPSGDGEPILTLSATSAGDRGVSADIYSVLPIYISSTGSVGNGGDVATAELIRAFVVAGHGVAGIGAPNADIPSLSTAGVGHGVGGAGIATATLALSFDSDSGRGVGASASFHLGIRADVVADVGSVGNAEAHIPIASAAEGSVDTFGEATAAINVSVTALGASGASGDSEVTLTLTLASDASARHGTAGYGEGSVTVTPAYAVGSAEGGVGANGSAQGSIPIRTEAVGGVIRFEVRGQVRLNGGLVDRSIRVYSVATGELLGMGDTVAGYFNTHAGFVQQECYIVPINNVTGATDFFPPCSNHVTNIYAGD